MRIISVNFVFNLYQRYRIKISNDINLLTWSWCTPVWNTNEPLPSYLTRKTTLLIDLACSQRVQCQKTPQKIDFLIHTTWNNIWLLSGGELSVLYCVWIHVNSCVEMNMIGWKSSNTKKVWEQVSNKIIINVYNEKICNYVVAV